MPRVYYSAKYDGAGYVTTAFFASKECLERLQEAMPYRYSYEHLGGSFEYEGKIDGLNVQSLLDVEQEIEEYENREDGF